MRSYRLEVKQGRDRLWYFHLRAPNGKIVMDSAQGYEREGAAARAAVRLFVVFEGHTIDLVRPGLNA